MRVVRVVGGATAALVGAVATLAGAVTAFWVVGPDDVLDTREHTLSTTGVALTTPPDLLDYYGSRAVVRVEAVPPDREVFVGVAHDVDVRSYLDGTAQTRITEVGYPSTLVTQDVDGATRAVTPPRTLDWWVARGQGGGATATLTWMLADGPYDLVVMGADGKPGLEVRATFGLEVKGAFRTSLLVLVAGVAFLAAAVVALRGGRRAPADNEIVWEGRDLWEDNEFWSADHTSAPVQRVGAGAAAGDQQTPDQASHPTAPAPPSTPPGPPPSGTASAPAPAAAPPPYGPNPMPPVPTAGPYPGAGALGSPAGPPGPADVSAATPPPEVRWNGTPQHAPPRQPSPHQTPPHQQAPPHQTPPHEVPPGQPSPHQASPHQAPLPPWRPAGGNPRRQPATPVETSNPAGTSTAQPAPTVPPTHPQPSQAGASAPHVTVHEASDRSLGAPDPDTDNPIAAALAADPPPPSSPVPSAPVPSAPVSSVPALTPAAPSTLSPAGPSPLSSLPASPGGPSGAPFAATSRPPAPASFTSLDADGRHGEAHV